MILILQFQRAFIIAWVAMCLAPVELLFDGIETELERRGVVL